MYKILGTDGKEYGPISADMVRQWITQHRANAATSIQAEGTSDWKPLASFPEFADALAGGTPVAPAPLAAPGRTSRLATASLICGVLGFLCLPAVAGVVMGIMALLKISKSRGQLRGQGLAIAGLCVSGVMLILIVPAGMLLPALSRAKAKAARINCVSHLKMICLGARIYSNDNKDVFPPDFQTMSNELNSPQILWCPADTKHTRTFSWATFDPRQNLSYEYLKPGIAESNILNASQEVIFRCPIHDNVGMADGSVQMLKKSSARGPSGQSR